MRWGTRAATSAWCPSETLGTSAQGLRAALQVRRRTLCHHRPAHRPAHRRARRSLPLIIVPPHAPAVQASSPPPSRHRRQQRHRRRHSSRLPHHRRRRYHRRRHRRYHRRRRRRHTTAAVATTTATMTATAATAVAAATLHYPHHGDRLRHCSNRSCPCRRRHRRPPAVISCRHRRRSRSHHPRVTMVTHRPAHRHCCTRAAVLTPLPPPVLQDSPSAPPALAPSHVPVPLDASRRPPPCYASHAHLRHAQVRPLPRQLLVALLRRAISSAHRPRRCLESSSTSHPVRHRQRSQVSAAPTLTPVLYLVQLLTIFPHLTCT